MIQKNLKKISSDQIKQTKIVFVILRSLDVLMEVFD